MARSTTLRTSATSPRDPAGPHGTQGGYMSQSSTPSPRHLRRPAFTLVEVLVVIGIMVVIAGIAIPMINKARKQGIRVRVAGDLNTIGVALEAYKNDFGDYPRDRKSTRLNSSHLVISYAVFCLK